jgi:hypothetical protein
VMRYEGMLLFVGKIKWWLLERRAVVACFNAMMYEDSARRWSYSPEHCIQYEYYHKFHTNASITFLMSVCY